MKRECPDYKTRKEPCKHLFATMLFVKNRGRAKIEGLEGKEIAKRVTQSLGNGKTLREKVPEASNKPTEIVQRVAQSNLSPQVDRGNSNPFDRQSTITRLAVLNTATEILKTHRKPIELMILYLLHLS